MTQVPDDWIAPEHDPFEGPDAEPEADSAERALADEEAAGDGEAEDVRRALGLDDEEDE